MAHNTNIPLTQENGYSQIMLKICCNYFAKHLQGLKIPSNIASLNRDKMNELFILFCFLLVMIPILIGTQAFENMVNNYDEEDQL